MSDQVFGDDEFDDGDDFDRGSRGGVGGKRGLIIAIVVVLLLLAAGAVALLYTGVLDDVLGGDSMGQPTPAASGGSQSSGGGVAATSSEGEGGGLLTTAPPYFYPPEMLVNLNATGGRNRFLKVSIALELRSGNDMQLVEHNLPRIIDMFQNYLHGLSVEQLQSGSAGLDRLREELQARANDAITGQDPVTKVLIQEMLVQ